jgi:hypothetical protein
MVFAGENSHDSRLASTGMGAGMRFLGEILRGNSPGIPHLSATILAYSCTFFDVESAEFPWHIVMKTG